MSAGRTGWSIQPQPAPNPQLRGLRIAEQRGSIQPQPAPNPQRRRRAWIVRARVHSTTTRAQSATMTEVQRAGSIQPQPAPNPQPLDPIPCRGPRRGPFNHNPRPIRNCSLWRDSTSQSAMPHSTTTRAQSATGCTTWVHSTTTRAQSATKAPGCPDDAEVHSTTTRAQSATTSPPCQSKREVHSTTTRAQSATSGAWGHAKDKHTLVQFICAKT